MIEIKNVTFKYIDKIAIKNLNLSIPKGEFLAILGHNGSGKSTLARLFNGLLVPSEGEMLINGVSTGDEDKLFDIRKTCGMVFQNPDNQIVATTVREDVAFGLENLGLPVSEMESCVEESLKSVGLDGFGAKMSSNLSGGQKQRVAIAGIIAMKPEIIVFDEPTAMLDPKGRNAVLDIIKKLKSEGKTIVLITHFMEEAALADRIVVLEKGEIALRGKPIEVFSEVEKMQKLGLNVPVQILLSHELGILKTLDLDLFAKYVKEKHKPINIEKTAKMLNSENVLKAENLTHIYSPNTTFQKISIENINLKIKKGAFLGVIGHTGSGKSTLIQHFNALLKATTGTIIAFGENIENIKDLRLLRQKVGLVFQYPEYQLFETTVFREVAYGPRNMGLSEEEIEKRVKYALDLVDIGEDFYEKSPFELSGGQKRRVAIAGILSMQPEVLILDEPTAGLDPEAKDSILTQIKKMHENGTTIIIVSHSMEDIAKFAHSVIVLKEGQIKYNDIPERVFENDKELQKYGLDIPILSKIAKELGLIPNIFTVDEMIKAIKGEKVVKK